MDKIKDIQKSKRLKFISLGATILLLIPLVAMQFTNEVNWSFFDFLIMGILLFATGIICELILQKFKSTQQRLILCGISLVLFLLIWAELAVGIFNSPIAGS
ncbi:MAG TPA: hypothetical protein VKY36_01060 [Moheibacter sp.]|nr:hypothetical protein [Moheibacter sp.]